MSAKGSSSNLKWISSSFAADDSADTKKTANNSAREIQSKICQPLTKDKYKKKRNIRELFVEIHAPQTQSDLAVHKKKVVEVESWLQEHLAQNLPSVLVLNGAAGVGKTATLKTLAIEMKLDIHEWTNPLTITRNYSFADERTKPEFRPVDEYPNYKSQSQQFLDFLLRANRYNKLQLTANEISPTRKLILVEDFPNIFYRDIRSFHETLRWFCHTGKCPLVFIITDSPGACSVKQLFPSDFQHSLNIHSINFNPVAPTLLAKALTRIASIEAKKNGSIPPSKKTIDGIVNASSGDIRSAINTLQFTCLQSSTSINSTKCKNNRKTTLKNKRADKKVHPLEKDISIGARDTAMFLFRALGKILYCKREAKSGDMDSLPTWFGCHMRDPLSFVPETVAEKTHMDSDLLMLYLHQNYLDFFHTIEDVVRGSEFMSDADFIASDWTARSVLKDYSCSLAVRGLIHANSTKSSTGAKWKPLHKPQYSQVFKEYSENSKEAVELFFGQCTTSQDFRTQYLPYQAIISMPLANPIQISFIEEVFRFPLSRSNYRAQPEKLDEKDVEISDTVVETHPESKKNRNDPEAPSLSLVMADDKDEDEEVVIEDFGDEW